MNEIGLGPVNDFTLVDSKKYLLLVDKYKELKEFRDFFAERLKFEAPYLVEHINGLVQAQDRYLQRHG